MALSQSSRQLSPDSEAGLLFGADVSDLSVTPSSGLSSGLLSSLLVRASKSKARIEERSSSSALSLELDDLALRSLPVDPFDVARNKRSAKRETMLHVPLQVVERMLEQHSFLETDRLETDRLETEVQADAHLVSAALDAPRAKLPSFVGALEDFELADTSAPQAWEVDDWQIGASFAAVAAGAEDAYEHIDEAAVEVIEEEPRQLHVSHYSPQDMYAPTAAQAPLAMHELVAGDDQLVSATTNPMDTLVTRLAVFLAAFLVTAAGSMVLLLIAKRMHLL
jgi:hypothetical protein